MRFSSLANASVRAANSSRSASQQRELQAVYLSSCISSSSVTSTTVISGLSQARDIDSDGTYLGVAAAGGNVFNLYTLNSYGSPAYSFSVGT
jgi:hypothetical protein